MIEIPISLLALTDVRVQGEIWSFDGDAYEIKIELPSFEANVRVPYDVVMEAQLRHRDAAVDDGITSLRSGDKVWLRLSG